MYGFTSSLRVRVPMGLGFDKTLFFGTSLQTQPDEANKLKSKAIQTIYQD